MKHSVLASMVIAVTISAFSAAAQTPPPAGVAPTGFDGIYTGVAGDYRGETAQVQKAGHSCDKSSVPALLTIQNAHALVKWGTETLQGDLNPAGALTMRNESGGTFSGQIDAQGVLKGRYTGECSYDLTWQKKRTG